MAQHDEPQTLFGVASKQTIHTVGQHHMCAPLCCGPQRAVVSSSIVTQLSGSVSSVCRRTISALDSDQ